MNNIQWYNPYYNPHALSALKKHNFNKTLESVLNDNDVFIMNSKERNIPINSFMILFESIKELKNNRPKQIILSSDHQGSGKTTSVLTSALYQASENDKNEILIIVPTNIICRDITCTLAETLLFWDELKEDERENFKLTLANDSSIIVRSINDRRLSLRHHYDLVIVDDAENLTFDYYSNILTQNLHDESILILTVNNETIKNKAIINLI